MLGIDCLSCGQAFIPRAKGYNARYCSDRCKRRSQRKRLKENNPGQLSAARKRSYVQTRAYPDRLSKHQDCSNRHRKATRDWLAAFKLASGCVDCGYRTHFAALQLDHEGPKSISIADARTSVKRLQEEIEAGRCKVRCGNCHAVRTWERKQQKANN